jgi:hypothetical protein
MVNTKQKDEIEFAAFMGIDWADQTHAWALELPRKVQKPSRRHCYAARA